MYLKKTSFLAIFYKIFFVPPHDKSIYKIFVIFNKIGIFFLALHIYFRMI